MESRRTIDVVCTSLNAIAVICFVAMFISILLLHGDAFSGKAMNGHYYVEYKGRYTEVSQTAYFCSKALTGSTLLCALLSLGANVVRARSASA